MFNTVLCTARTLISSHCKKICWNSLCWRCGHRVLSLEKRREVSHLSFIRQYNNSKVALDTLWNTRTISCVSSVCADKGSVPLSSEACVRREFQSVSGFNVEPWNLGPYDVGCFCSQMNYSNDFSQIQCDALHFCIGLAWKLHSIESAPVCCSEQDLGVSAWMSKLVLLSSELFLAMFGAASPSHLQPVFLF